MRFIKKSTALLLLFIMIITTFPIQIIASETVGNTEIESTNYDTIETPPEDKLVLINNVINSIADMYSNVSKDEWKIVGLSAIDRKLDVNKEGFITHLEEVLASDGSYRKNVKNLEKAVIALSSLNIDATSFPLKDGETIDILSMIANNKDNNGEYDLIDIGGYSSALSAYDSGEYEDTGYFTREVLIEKLINSQEANGSYIYYGVEDADMSSMIVSSLSPYYNTNPDVKTAIDKYVDWVSKIQLDDGTYESWGTSNSSTTSTVVTTLSSLGIDSDKDSRFIKNGKSAMDGLLSFRMPDNTFMFQSLSNGGGVTNDFSTESAFMALISYKKLQDSRKAYNIYQFGKITTDGEVIEYEPVIIDIVDDTNSTYKISETNILPKMTITQKTGNIIMNVEKDTKVTSASALAWDGIIQLPKIIDAPTIKGIDISLAIKVGANVDLKLNKPVRILIPNSKDKMIGYINSSGILTEIKNVIQSDSSGALSFANDGKITIGNDTAIWTKHFTTFIIYTNTPSTGTDQNTYKTVYLSVVGDSNKGTILSNTSINTDESKSAFDIVKQILDENKISFSSNGANYITEIGGLSEFDNGPNSGWLYYINGTSLGFGIGDYVPKNGDTIKLKYTNDHTIDSPLISDTTSSGTSSSSVSITNTKVNISKTLDKISKKTTLSEWEIISLLKNDVVIKEDYLKKIEDSLKEKNGELKLATDYAKLVFLLKASNKSIRDFAGYDILKKIYNNEDAGKQGVNGYVFSLLVLNNEKDLPINTFWNKDKLVKKILEYKNNDGGFSLSVGEKSDIDITAMVLSSLAPYKHEEDIKLIIDRAVSYLKENQQSDTSESISQVIIALCSLEINPINSDFSKNGLSLIDILSSYKLSDDTFSNTINGGSNEISTEQALLALTAYNLYCDKKGSLYSFSENTVDEVATKKEELTDNAVVNEKYVSKFTDISNYDWAEKEINYFAEKGVINGVSETIFSPSAKIKRGDYISLIVRMLDLKGTVNSNFTDVPKDMYYYNEIGIAKSLGLISGIGNNEFGPEESITRQDMFFIANNVLKMKKIHLDNADDNIIKSFNDYEKISDYSKDTFSTFVKNNIILGSDNNLNPLGNATRAECAVFIYRLERVLD